MGSSLSQQQLLEPAPPRTLRVPTGAEAHWGVDSSTRCVSIGTARATPEDEVLRRVRTAYFPTQAGAPRLATIYAMTRELAYDLARLEPPGYIGVERAASSNRGTQDELTYTVGIVQAAIYDGVTSAGRTPHIELIASSHWKAVACGDGRIKKTAKDPRTGREKRLPLEDYQVMKWARLIGYAGLSWDEADALAQAECGRRDVGLQPR